MKIKQIEARHVCFDLNKCHECGQVNARITFDGRATIFCQCSMIESKPERAEEIWNKYMKGETVIVCAIDFNQ